MKSTTARRQKRIRPNRNFDPFKPWTNNEELTQNEAAAVQYFARELRTAKGADSAITNGYLVDNWNWKNPNQKINDASGRRIIRHIRVNGIIKKLMADSYGYFIANDDDAYNRYLDMLQRRIKTISRTHKAMRNQ
jgi:hypothetical protein